MKRISLVALALWQVSALAVTPGLEKTLPGVYEGRSFNGETECRVQVREARKLPFASPRLEVKIFYPGTSMSYTAKASNLARTLAEGHHGEGLAFEETVRGFLEQTRRYVSLRVEDGRLLTADLSYTRSQIYVLEAKSLDCGNLEKIK
jgi:hypothetical protein